MTPGARMVQDFSRLVRADRRQAFRTRQQIYGLVGAPIRASRAPSPAAHHLVGGAGAEASVPQHNVLTLPSNVHAMQDRGPVARATQHQNCCHCAGAQRVQAHYRRRTVSTDAAAALAQTIGLDVRQGAQVLSGRAPVLPQTEMFDVHSHFFGATMSDFIASSMFRYLHPHLATATYERIKWLTNNIGKAGVDRMCLSGFFDGTAPAPEGGDWRLGDVEAGHFASEVNLSVRLAAELHPDFFVPFVNGFSLSMPTSSFPPTVADILDSWDGWRGVGELIVHGHGENINEDDGDPTKDYTRNIAYLVNEATKRGLPVMLHWDMGAVDNEAERSASQNFDQFVKLLELVDKEAVIILAHCGIGPYQGSPSDTDESTAWERRMTGDGAEPGLLNRTNCTLLFDLAGMQVGPVNQLMNALHTELTAVGSAILGWIHEYPERFMLGIDAETRALDDFIDGGGNPMMGISTYEASVPNYTDFLAFGLAANLIFQSDYDAVRTHNAEALFP